ncbi:Uncharacterised protein [Mycobacteroides abscessus subsp. abscessus]|nr:Uncharacterised protein [Mycobacteroides abscessus subsp. abscessus]
MRTCTPLRTCSRMVARGESMQHDGVVGQQPHPTLVEAVAHRVFARGREEATVHALRLHPQHHHGVGAR